MYTGRPLIEVPCGVLVGPVRLGVEACHQNILLSVSSGLRSLAVRIPRRVRTHVGFKSSQDALCCQNTTVRGFCLAMTAEYGSCIHSSFDHPHRG